VPGGLVTARASARSMRSDGTMERTYVQLHSIQLLPIPITGWIDHHGAQAIECSYEQGRPRRNAEGGVLPELSATLPSLQQVPPTPDLPLCK